MLRPHEVVEALSIREFTSLCALLDSFTAPSQAMIGNGPASPVRQVAGKLIETKFRVVRVDRLPDLVKVLVDEGKGVVHWYAIHAETKKPCNPVTVTNSTRAA